MSDIKVQPNVKGLLELMRSEEIQHVLLEEADKVVSRCEGNYDTDVYVGKKARANASIVTHDEKTYFKNLKENELLKALGI